MKEIKSLIDSSAKFYGVDLHKERQTKNTADE